jgi:hypothetical protein
LRDWVSERLHRGTKTTDVDAKEELMRYARLGFVALAAVGLIVGGGCDDDTRDKAEEAVEDVQEKAGEAGARAAAEGLRASLKAQDTDDASGGVRNVQVVQSAAADLPGDTEFIGIADDDGDGRDDDGYVQANVGDESACVTLPESGDDIDVSGGACPGGQ